MTKQEKFLLLVVLVVSGVGATIYVQNTKKDQAAQNNFGVQEVVVENQNNNSDTVNNISDTETMAGQGSAVSNTEQNSNSNMAASAKTLQSSVSYTTPEGHSETLSVVVTLQNGVISDISFSEVPTNKESKEYYNKFSSKFSKSILIGKTLSEASIQRTGGASLTTAAFNAALKKLSS